MDKHIVKAVSVEDAFEQIASNIAYHRQLGSDTTPYPKWGFSLLDKVTGGILPESYTLLLGPPGEGKSTLAANVAVNNARAGRSVAIWAAEMGARSTAALVASIMTGVRRNAWRDMTATDNEIAHARDALSALNGNLVIVETKRGGEEAVDAIEGWVAANKPDLVIVDYLQFVAGMISRKDLVTQLAEMSRRIATMSIMHRVSFLVLAAKRRDDDGVHYSMTAQYDAAVIISVKRDDSASVLGGGHSAVAIRVKVTKNRFGPLAEMTLALDPARGIVYDTVSTPIDELAEAATKVEEVPFP